MKYSKNLSIFSIIIMISGFAAAQDRPEDMSKALNSINENNRYVFVSYLSHEEQSQAQVYLKGVPPSDYDAKYESQFDQFSKDFDHWTHWNIQPHGHQSLYESQFLLVLMRRIINDIGNLPCVGRDSHTRVPEIKIESRFHKNSNTYTPYVHQDVAVGEHEYRAILMLQGEPTLFYNTSHFDDADLGKIEADQAPAGAIAFLKKGSMPRQFGAIHAGPNSEECSMGGRVIVLVNFYYGCGLDPVPKEGYGY